MYRQRTRHEHSAAWDFILEHSDITKGGALFVKFHTSHRSDFERRLKARLRVLKSVEQKNRRRRVIQRIVRVDNRAERGYNCYISFMEDTHKENSRGTEVYSRRQSLD